MRDLPLPLFSDGLLLDAELHLPEETEQPFPLVIPLSGFTGLRGIHPLRFARALTPHGYAVLTVEYRGNGESEGERGRLIPQEQVEDVRAGLDRVSLLEEIDTQRVSVLGWGQGGGIAVELAATDPRVHSVIVCNGIAEGRRSVRNTHTAQTWEKLLHNIQADRGYRAQHGRSQRTSPWNITRLAEDLDTDAYVANHLTPTPTFGAEVTWQSAEAMLRFNPIDEVHKIAGRPITIVHGEKNRLYKPLEAYALFEAACEPKELTILENVGHTEWMHDKHPTFQKLVDVVCDAAA